MVPEGVKYFEGEVSGKVVEELVIDNQHTTLLTILHYLISYTGSNKTNLSETSV